jgi:phenylacetate-CoA ligase
MDYQFAELRRILRHAYERMSGYRAAFLLRGVSPESLQKVEDLRKFPFSEKETIRDYLEDFSVAVDGRTYVTTEEITGIPFGLFRDPEAFPKELASKAHQYERVGWLEGERQLVFRGVPIDSPDHMLFVPDFSELRCSSYHLTPELMETYRQCTIEYRPEWIRCYPSPGDIFARWLKDTGQSFPSIKGIFGASENLYEFQKKLISEVFHARAFSHYGHYELAVLVGFCEHNDNYHVLPQYGFTMLLDADDQPVTQPGQMGEIVATSFLMMATPIIRYRTRDYAIYEGRGCPDCRRPINYGNALREDCRSSSLPSRGATFR